MQSAELGASGFSIKELMTELIKRFPERKAKGMEGTVRQAVISKVVLERYASGKKWSKEKVDGRGLVYTLAKG